MLSSAGRDGLVGPNMLGFAKQANRSIPLNHGVRQIGVWLTALLSLAAIGACDGDATTGYQGYVDADYLRVAPRAPGDLETLMVHRGQWVSKGDELFLLDTEEAEASFARAVAQLAEAEAARADALKGIRTEEQNVLHAQLEQAEASLELSRLQLERLHELLVTNATSQGRVDEAQAAFERDVARAQEISAAVGVGDLGQRPDRIAQLDAAVETAIAGRDLAAWQLSERLHLASTKSLVFDTLYVVGEFVAAGRPVVVLLPPENRKVIFYVPETSVAALSPGIAVSIACDGCSAGIEAEISYISPDAEFTPPVIYSENRREKLVYRAEARFAADQPGLNPGIPVVVTVHEQ